MRPFDMLVLAAIGTAAIAFQAAAQAPGSAYDMKGTWKGVRQSITDGVTPHHPPSAQKGAAGRYRLTEVNVTFRIEGQEGGRFWGTMSSEHFTNRLIGSQSMDGKWLYMAGAEGLLDGQVIDADTIEVCYRHANAASATVGCNLMKRQK